MFTLYPDDVREYLKRACYRNMEGDVRYSKNIKAFDDVFTKLHETDIYVLANLLIKTPKKFEAEFEQFCAGREFSQQDIIMMKDVLIRMRRMYSRDKRNSLRKDGFKGGNLK